MKPDSRWVHGEVRFHFVRQMHARTRRSHCQSGPVVCGRGTQSP